MVREKQPARVKQKAAIDLDDPSLYANRELSWLEFNRRVFEEAQDPHTPSLEKLKFASIFSSNLDEYFMVRVGGLFRVINADVDDIDASGRTARQQLDEIAEKVRTLVAEQYRCFTEEVLPRLQKARIFLHRIDTLDKKEKKRLEEYFEAQVFPVLTPLAVDAGHPFPFIANLRLNLMVVFKEASGIKVPQAYAFVEVPSILPRLVPVHMEMKGYHFILLEDLVREHIRRLFPGMEIKNIIAFRVTRNHDYDLLEDEVMDLLKSVEAEIRDRSDKIAVRLEIELGAPKKVIQLLARQLGFEERFIYEINGPINICDFLSLYELPVDLSH